MKGEGWMQGQLWGQTGFNEVTAHYALKSGGRVSGCEQAGPKDYSCLPPQVFTFPNPAGLQDFLQA